MGTFARKRRIFDESSEPWEDHHFSDDPILNRIAWLANIYVRATDGFDDDGPEGFDPNPAVAERAEWELHGLVRSYHPGTLFDVADSIFYVDDRTPPGRIVYCRHPIDLCRRAELTP